MNEKADSLYICPWSLNDPLCRSQSLAYINILTEYGYKFALVTFETDQFALSGEERRKTAQELAARGIYWHPVKWHLNLALPKKSLGGLRVLQTVLNAARRHRPRLVHSRSSTPAFFAALAARLFKLKFLYDADSVLSQEYVDVGHWPAGGVNHKIMTAIEANARRRADEIIVLTETLKRDFSEKFNVKKNIEVIPCCVDTEKFTLPPAAGAAEREKRRREIGLADDEKLLVYVGKIGARYQVEKIFEFCERTRGEINARLLIVSRDAAARFDEIAARAGVERKNYFVAAAAPAEVAGWLAAADAGLAFIKSAESERGASPVKISEYLAAGLPVLTTGGIGDLSDLIAREKVGAVVEDFAQAACVTAARRLADLWKDADSSARCRRIARRAFDLREVGGRKYLSIYKRLLNGP